MYRCSRCPDARAFDVLKHTGTAKNPGRCFQYHVEQVHADYQGDWQDLIAETITLNRRRRSVSNAPANPTDTAAESSTMSTQTPASTTPTAPAPFSVIAAAQEILDTEAALEKEFEEENEDEGKDQDLENQDQVDYLHPINLYSPTYEYDKAALIRHARRTAVAILNRAQNSQPIEVALDVWDKAAFDGLLHPDVCKLAKAAFPRHSVTFNPTVCKTSDPAVAGHMVKFFMEKADRYESRAD